MEKRAEEYDLQAQYDPRITPVRRDIAARSVASLVSGLAPPPRLVDGRRERVVAGLADMRGAPDPGASLTTQALRGEAFDIYEIEEG